MAIINIGAMIINIITLLRLITTTIVFYFCVCEEYLLCKRMCILYVHMSVHVVCARMYAFYGMYGMCGIDVMYVCMNVRMCAHMCMHTYIYI